MRTGGKGRNEKGAMTIIEATFVFPIMFFVVFFMIMAGEAYYQHAKVEYYVTAAAINGASRCENPMLGTVLDKGTVPTDPAAADVMPYRYIFTGEANKIAVEIESELQKKVDAMKPLLFKAMRPTDVNVDAVPKLNPLISTFSVTCEFDVPLPIRMIFSDEDLKFSYSVNVNTSVGDPSEFVRNVSTVADLLERNAAFSEFCGKIRTCMEKIGACIG